MRNPASLSGEMGFWNHFWWWRLRVCRYTSTNVQNAVRSRKFFRNFRISRWSNASIVLESFTSWFHTAASIWRAPDGTLPIMPTSQDPTAPLRRKRVNRNHPIAPTAQIHPPKRRPPKKLRKTPLLNPPQLDSKLFFKNFFKKTKKIGTRPLYKQ